MRRAKALGYTVHAVFVGTESHDINISRVQRRVGEGGHNVPPDEIIRRWQATQTNLIRTWPCFETVSILDNSGNEPVAVAWQQGDSRETVVNAPPRWVRRLLLRRTGKGTS
ncbi:MAG: hypothetical protein F4X98_18105 [Gammaproteobacteria bacterium]|nr:hypothetical protein [Gammaproteobacteria bacterium]